MQALVYHQPLPISSRRRRGHGFTLLELLTVIAIMALLLSLLFPAFQSARDRAAQATCASNLRQMGSLAFLVAADLQGQLPPSRISAAYLPDLMNARSIMNVLQNVEAGKPPGSYWVNAKAPYSKVFLCPADRNANHGLAKGHAKAISYGNVEGSWRLLPGTDYTAKPLPLTVIRRPSQTVLFIEHDNLSPQNDFQIFAPGGGFTNALPTENPKVDGEIVWGNSNLPLRHGKDTAFNCLYVDGHSEMFTWPAYPAGLLQDDILRINQ